MAVLTPEQRARYQRLAEMRNSGGGLTPQQRQRLRNLETLRAEGGSKSLLDKAMGGVNYGDAGFVQRGTGGGTGGDVLGAGTGSKQIDRSTDRAENLLESGNLIAERLLPEVFEGGSGLDRIDFNPIEAGKVSFADINQYLQPSIDDAIAFRGDTASRYDELLGLRRDKLGGLDAAENQALKASLFRDIDRERAGAMRDVARTSGLGAGGSFAQRRALGRDYGEAAIDANRKLTLDNVAIKQQALDSLEGTTGARTGALGAIDASLAGLRGTQANFKSGVDQFNTSNKLTADQYNSQGNLLTDQFNAGQLDKELAARIGAVSAGTGMVGDERDLIRARKELNRIMDFMREQQAQNISDFQSLFGG